MEAGEEQRVREAGVGDLVAEGVRDAFDEPVQAQAAQVVGHLPGGHGLGGHAEEGRQDGAQVAVGEAAGQQPEDAQGGEQGVDAGVAEAQPGDAGPGRVVTGSQTWAMASWPPAGSWLSFWTSEQTPVGGEADLPQRGQVGQPFPDAEVAGVVDRGFGPERLAVPCGTA